jgi:hypothetical protein
MKRLILLVAIALIWACSPKNTGEVKVNIEQVKADLQALSETKLFFGHQSVGRNIIRGIKELMQKSGVHTLHIIDAKKDSLPEFYFAQANVGKNKFPQTKCADFARLIREKLGPDGVQFAFLKFCFVDVTRKSDVHEILREYRSTIDTLQQEFPQITFVRFTVPLKVKSAGFKSTIKRWLGKASTRDLDNAKRNAYNRLLKETFRGKPVFDLAAVESTYPDGERETFTLKGQTLYSLVPRYSSDGGHLNAQGRQWVAAHLLHYLARLVKEKTHAGAVKKDQ